MWDERYDQTEYAYGEAANLYLKDRLVKIPVGKIKYYPIKSQQ